MRAMSNDRDINDILDSLNQLLREGESHNDDHVETDGQAGEIEAELHELEEDDVESEEPAAEGPDAESEEAESEQAEGDVDASGDASNELSSEYLDDLSEGFSEEEEEDFQEAPISIQRVVLTEEMLVNNPQGNLLSMVKENEEVDVEPVADAEPIENESVGTVQEESSEQEAVRESVHQPAHETHGSNIDGLPTQQQLEQLVEKVSDDVITRLQQELPSLIMASLHRRFSELKDAELRDEELSDRDQSENHSEE